MWFKPRVDKIEEGTIYTYLGKQPIFVPETKALSESEALALQEELERSRERLEVLRTAVKELLPLHQILGNVKMVISPLQPLDPSEKRAVILIEVLRQAGYWTAKAEGKGLWSGIEQPQVIKEIIEELS